MDLSILAQNLPQIAGILGAVHGGGSSHASVAGALAGLGDAQHERNQRSYEGVKAFADQLEQIGKDTENWSEEARTAAMQERLNLLSPKTIAKIYSNPGAADKVMSGAWENLRQASSRPVDSATQQADKNSAASRIPALQNLQSPPPNALVGTPLSALGPMVSAGSQAATQSQIATDQQTLAAPGQAQRFGPLSPGEKARRGYEAIRPFLSGGMQPDGSGGYGPQGNGSGGPQMAPHIDSRGHFSAVPIQPSFTTEQQRYIDPTTGQERAGSVWIDHKTQHAFVDGPNGSKQPVRLIGKVRPDSVRSVHTMENGKPVTLVDYASDMAGKSYASPVQTKTWMSTGPNGERFEYDVKPGFNGQPNTIVSKRQIGITPFSTLRAQMMSLGIEGKSLTNALSEYKLNGSVTLPDGTRYIPNGTLLDPNGQPIAPAAGPGARPPARAMNRVQVAGQLTSVIDEMRNDMKTLESYYGPIRGRITDWAAAHGIDPTDDSAEAQALGRIIANTTTMGGLSTTVHSFMSGEFAKQFDDTIGMLGQDINLARGKMDALYGFAGRVSAKDIYTPLPTQKNLTPRSPTAPKNPNAASASAPTSTSAAAPSSNAQTLQAIAKLLGGQ